MFVEIYKTGGHWAPSKSENAIKFVVSKEEKGKYNFWLDFSLKGGVTDGSRPGIHGALRRAYGDNYGEVEMKK